MGVVYRAHDLALDRKVALKLLAPELAEDVRFRERFLRESRLAASLDHPAIIPIYDAGEVGGQLYIAMRLVDGTDLKRLLAEEGVLDAGARARRCSSRSRTRSTRRTSAASSTATSSRRTSCVDERGHCYLADFGLSRRLAEQAPRLGAGPLARHRRLRRARADPRRGARRARRSLLARLPALRVPGRAAAVRPRLGHGDRVRAPRAGAAGAARARAGAAKALAKEPDDRYQSGRELVAAARDALRTDARAEASSAPRGGCGARRSGAVIGGVLATRGRARTGSTREARSPSRSQARTR